MPLVLRAIVHCDLLTVLHYNDYRLLKFEEVLFWLLFLAFLHALPNNLRGMASSLHMSASHLCFCLLVSFLEKLPGLLKLPVVSEAREGPESITIAFRRQQ